MCFAYYYVENEVKMKYYKRESYLQKIRGFYDEAEIIKVITGVRRCKMCQNPFLAVQIITKRTVYPN